MLSSTSTKTLLWWTASLAAAALSGFGVGLYVSSRPKAPKLEKPPNETREGTAPTDSDSEDDTNGFEDIAKVKAGILEPCKMILVVRTDLGMTKGKIAAQCSHATLACYKALFKANPALVKHWERTGQAKIAVQCKSEEELLLLQATAQSLNLVARSIQDAGRTQIAAGSTTVLGIGPGPVKLVDQVTKDLKLL